jgi:hypothetical protein
MLYDDMYSQDKTKGALRIIFSYAIGDVGKHFKEHKGSMPKACQKGRLEGYEKEIFNFHLNQKINFDIFKKLLLVGILEEGL